MCIIVLEIVLFSYLNEINKTIKKCNLTMNK